MLPLPPIRVLAQGLAVFLATAAVTSMLFIDFCHLVFQCGCRSWWSGAAEACNIHIAGVPHCPWCTSGGFSGYLGYGAILIAQAAISFWPGSLTAVGRVLGSLAAFAVVGGIAALLAGLATGYWSG
jgi:hypothetical protein